MATWLASQSKTPEWLWVSSARRARETAQFVLRGLALDEQSCEHTRAELYHASTHTLLETLRATPETVTRVAIVAHNPGLTHLTNQLAGDHVTDNLPTFGIARFDYSGDWPEFRPAAARLRRLTSPKTVPPPA